MHAFLLPGQGTQSPGMGAPWQDDPAWSVVGVVSDATGVDVAHLLLHADDDELRRTDSAQLASFTLGLVAVEAARAAGHTPDVVAGHSLGELTALVVAGALEVADGARLVLERGRAMVSACEANPGTMVAVLGLEHRRVVDAIAAIDGTWVANDNAPGQAVVAGTHEGVGAAETMVRATGAMKVVELPVAGAFHTPLMAPAAAHLAGAIAATPFAPSTVPVVANVDAEARTEGFADPLARQLTAPVRWRESLLTLAGLGVDEWWELGPSGANLLAMVRRTVGDGVRVGVHDPADVPAA
ncbi:MAG: ACP S-malonyltransferase [Acidimicrobiia bacterium]|nr:ACP S-malonyltransferase [Acidimicrobiia bacterium]